LHQLGQNDASLEALQRATQSGQISSNTAYYIAAVLHARGNLDDAELYLKRALESSRPFSMRPEAEKLLEEIRREQGS
jgi:tetratricopeptide (TPR) repeat protein